MRVPLLIVLFAAGCYQPQVAPGLPCAENGACPEGLECTAGTCEFPGGGDEPDAAIDACPAATCTGDSLVGCGAPTLCATGCSEIGGAHCRQLVPSNGVTTAQLAGATADMAGGDWDFNTETGEIKKGNMMLRAPGSGVVDGIGFYLVDGMAVFTAHSFTLGVTDDWSAVGNNTFVLFSATTILVDGDIDVGGNLNNAGPGGSNATSLTSGSGCRGRAGRSFAAGFAEGGGGGGGRVTGGDGGASDQGASAGLGGVQCSTSPSTIPLRGGPGGGHGGGQFANSGGGGGGGLALVAMEAITITGDVGSPGGPGQSGAGPSPSGDGGGGGGSGGAVLIEAPLVTINGALTANGGSGGAPFMTDGQRGNIASTTSVPGGSYMGVSGGRGGTGTLSPNNGGNYTTTDMIPVPPVVTSSRGGGGGAAGRTEIKALIRDTSGATMSPGPALTMATLE